MDMAKEKDKDKDKVKDIKVINNNNIKEIIFNKKLNN